MQITLLDNNRLKCSLSVVKDGINYSVIYDMMTDILDVSPMPNELIYEDITYEVTDYVYRELILT